MGIIINCRATSVKTNLSFMDWFKFFFSMVSCIIDCQHLILLLQRRISYFSKLSKRSLIKKNYPHFSIYIIYKNKLVLVEGVHNVQNFLFLSLTHLLTFHRIVLNTKSKFYLWSKMSFFFIVDEYLNSFE